MGVRTSTHIYTYPDRFLILLNPQVYLNFSKFVKQILLSSTGLEVKTNTVLQNYLKYKAPLYFRLQASPLRHFLAHKGSLLALPVSDCTSISSHHSAFYVYEPTVSHSNQDERPVLLSGISTFAKHNKRNF